MSGEYPFGIDDAKVTAWNGATLGSTKVDVLGVTALSVNTESTTIEHRGDNQQMISRKSAKTVSGSVAQAAHQNAAIAVYGDGAVVSTGTTPNVVSTYTEPAAMPGKRYQIEAQAAGGNGDAARITVFKGSTSSGPSFDWSIESFSNPGWDYDALATTVSSTSVFYKLEQYETAVNITT